MQYPLITLHLFVYLINAVDALLMVKVFRTIMKVRSLRNKYNHSRNYVTVLFLRLFMFVIRNK